jgi:hypothetical protein
MTTAEVEEHSVLDRLEHPQNRFGTFRGAETLRKRWIATLRYTPKRPPSGREELKMLRTTIATKKRQPPDDASVVNLVAPSTIQNGLTLPTFIASSTLVKDHVRGSDCTKHDY